MATFVLSNRPPPPADARAPWWRRRWKSVALLAVVVAVGLYVRHLQRGIEVDVHPVRVHMTDAERAALRQSLPGARDVTFRTSDGLTLSGWFAPGTNGAAIVLTHGAWSNRSQLGAEAARLFAHGYGVLVYDLRADGDSEGDTCTWGDRERRDVAAAVDFIARQPGVAHVGAVGFSIGSTALSGAASKEPRIEAMALLGATPSLLEGIQWDQRRTHGLLSRPALQIYRWYGWNTDEINVVAALRATSPRPTLVVIGSEDPFIPRWMTDEVLAAAPEPKAEYTVLGAGHGEYAKYGGEPYLDRLVTFFDQSLLKR